MRFLAFIALVFLAAAAPGWAGEAIVTSEVSVDATGKDAADARTIAMGNAGPEALKDLLNKLAAPGQADIIIATLDTKKISGMMRGTEVLEEKIGDTRYRARLIVSFDADEVSNLITQFGIGSGKEEVASKTSSFLFLTSYEEDGTTLLWEDRNPWRQTWRMLGLENNTGDIVVPYGDNNDQSIISLKNLTTANYATLAPLAIRYGVSDVLILQAKYVKLPDMMLTVVKRRVNRTLNEVNVVNYRADLQETRDLLLARAARDIVDGLLNKKNEEISTTQGGLIGSGEKGKIMMLASITTLGSWTELRGKLEKLPMIEKLEILAMSPSQVDIVVHYRGSLESLEGGISGIGLRLLKNKNYWVVSRD
jgi:hypothetical protein